MRRPLAGELVVDVAGALRRTCHVGRDLTRPASRASWKAILLALIAAPIVAFLVFVFYDPARATIDGSYYARHEPFAGVTIFQDDYYAGSGRIYTGSSHQSASRSRLFATSLDRAAVDAAIRASIPPGYVMRRSYYRLDQGPWRHDPGNLELCGEGVRVDFHYSDGRSDPRWQQKVNDPRLAGLISVVIGEQTGCAGWEDAPPSTRRDVDRVAARSDARAR